MHEPSSPAAPTIAVVLAGGSGSRMGASVPKQFLKVGGKPVLGHTLEAFQEASQIDAIVLVTAVDWVESAEAVARAVGATKVTAVVGGGATRAESSRAAVAFAAANLDPGGDAKVLIHDAARMLVSGKIIADVVGALEEWSAVTVAVPVADTVVEVRSTDAGEVLSSVPDRARLRRVQTPQGFRFGVLASAHEMAASDPDFTATDDCSMVMRFLPDVPVRVIAGSERNLKVTEPVDLAVAAALLDAD